MTNAAKRVANSVPTVSPAPVAPAPSGSRLTPAFRVELRSRNNETAAPTTVVINARTIASARHTARLEHPDMVVLSVVRL